MALYFMRHAQTPGNAKHVWVGRQNEALTEKGKLQAQNAANDLAAMAIDCIYVSPLQRALTTAHIVARKQNEPPIVEIREGLQERDFGCFQGLEKTPENRIQLDIELSVETIKSMQQRLLPVLQEITALRGNVLIVSHSAVFRCLVQAMGCTASPAKVELENAEWVELFCSSPGWG